MDRLMFIWSRLGGWTLLEKSYACMHAFNISPISNLISYRKKEKSQPVLCA